MSRTVEILLIIGILVNIIKGAELILRPHQQRWLQANFETLVLWFDYTKPFDWFIKREGAKKIYRPEYAAIFPFCIGMGIVFNVITRFGWYWWVILIILFFIYLTVNDVRGLNPGEYSEDNIPALLSAKVEFRLIGWLFGSRSVRQQFIRHLIVITAGTIAFFLYYTIQHMIPVQRNVIPIVLVSLIWGLLSLPIIAIVMFGILSLSMLIFSFLCLIIELLLRIIRGVAWRIAEYHKGAFAAIILIITVALGLTEFYLNFQPPPTSPVITSPSATPQL